MALLLFPGVIGLYIDRGLAPAHAQSTNIEVPLVKVDTGQCEIDEIYTIAIHGGSVDWRDNHAAKTSYRNPLLTKARSLLASGARAIDVVEAVISSMEDSAFFNAGKGAIANQAGVIELDASIMDGRKLQAGAVAAVLVVEEIEAEVAKVIYAYGMYPFWGDGLYRQITGVFMEDGLQIIEPTDLGGSQSSIA